MISARAGLISAALAGGIAAAVFLRNPEPPVYTSDVLDVTPQSKPYDVTPTLGLLPDSTRQRQDRPASAINDRSTDLPEDTSEEFLHPDTAYRDTSSKQARSTGQLMHPDFGPPSTTAEPLDTGDRLDPNEQYPYDESAAVEASSQFVAIDDPADPILMESSEARDNGRSLDPTADLWKVD